MLLDQLNYLLEAFFTAPVKKTKDFFCLLENYYFLVHVMPNVIIMAKLLALF